MAEPYLICSYIDLYSCLGVCEEIREPDTGDFPISPYGALSKANKLDGYAPTLVKEDAAKLIL